MGSACIFPEWGVFGRDVRLTGALETVGCLAIADDDCYLDAGQAASLNRVDDGLQVGSGTRDEDGDSGHWASIESRDSLRPSLRESAFRGKSAV